MFPTDQVVAERHVDTCPGTCIFPPEVAALRLCNSSHSVGSNACIKWVTTDLFLNSNDVEHIFIFLLVIPVWGASFVFSPLHFFFFS